MPTVISTRMPNQIAFDSGARPHRSRPITAGKMTGMVSSSIDSSSITQPSSTYSSSTAATTITGGTAKCETQLAMPAGIWVIARAEFIMSAPRKIMNTMAEVSAVPRKLRTMPARFSSRRARPASRVPTAPTAAPSVGENTPP